MTDADRQLSSLAGRINGISGSLQRLGIDATALQITAGAFQLVGGSGQIIRGIIAAKSAYNAMRLAEGTAQLAKYTLGAAAVAAAATAGGVAMGVLIDRTINATGDGAGIRAISGGRSNAGRY